MKGNLWFISFLIFSVFVCGYSFSQERHEETNVQEVFSYPYPVKREVSATEVQTVSSPRENMEVIPESVEEIPLTEEIEESVSPQEEEVPAKKIEKNVNPRVLGVPAHKEMKAVAAPAAQPVEIIGEKKNIPLPRKASERIKGMQRLDDISPGSVD